VDLDTNHSFNVLSAAKNTFADYITVRGSSFENVTGAVFKLDKEDDDYGIYNAEYLTISDSIFKNIGGDIVDYYRGGRDESTFGPHFSLTGIKI
jgi:poly(beta-D-mannuronate) lyase